MDRSDPPSQRALADFADALEAGRAEILAIYEAGMEGASALIARDPLSRRQVMVHSDQIITDVVISLRASRVVMDDTYRIASYESGVTRARRGMHPRESMGTASSFFATTVDWVVPRLPEGPDGLAVLAVVCSALNRSLTRRLGEGLATYSGYLLGKIHGAHVEERRRIARELHDRVGAALSVTHRFLELAGTHLAEGSPKAAEYAQRADASAREAMTHLRAVTSELRLQEPLCSLEQALETFLQGAAEKDLRWRVTVNGDETWAAPSVRDETFLVLREALRNALKHSAATLVVVTVDIAPDELRGTVMDDGHGFDAAHPPHPGGSGLSVMRERIELMGGDLTVSSVPDGGARVDVVVPLSGRVDDGTGTA